MNRKTFEKELEILGLIHARSPLSRAELVKLTGLSGALISAAVRRLVARNLIVESGLEPSKLGRRRVALEFRAGEPYTIGIEIGGYFLRIVITDIAGNVCHQLQTETLLSEGFSAVMGRCFAAIDRAMSEAGIKREALAGIGVAHSGVVDSKRGIVLSFPRREAMKAVEGLNGGRSPGQMSEWRNAPIGAMFGDRYGLPCFVDDSVRMAALAEKEIGIARELSDFIYIRIGMGIGSCIYLNGESYRGGGGSAGEFGHITVQEDGPLCYCGNTGCLSTLASCSVIIQQVAAAIGKGVHSRIQEMVEDNLDRINIELILNAVQEKDPLAFRVLNDASMHIGVALADVVNLLNPSVVVFGGPLFQSNPQPILDSIQRVIRQRALEKSANEVELIVSSLGPESPALGAARFAAARSIPSLHSRRT